jgi:hypothetical protein
VRDFRESGEGNSPGHGFAKPSANADVCVIVVLKQGLCLAGKLRKMCDAREWEDGGRSVQCFWEGFAGCKVVWENWRLA